MFTIPGPLYISAPSEQALKHGHHPMYLDAMTRPVFGRPWVKGLERSRGKGPTFSSPLSTDVQPHDNRCTVVRKNTGA